jgi:hypothetical protein
MSWPGASLLVGVSSQQNLTDREKDLVRAAPPEIIGWREESTSLNSLFSSCTGAKPRRSGVIGNSVSRPPTLPHAHFLTSFEIAPIRFRFESPQDSALEAHAVPAGTIRLTVSFEKHPLRPSSSKLQSDGSDRPARRSRGGPSRQTAGFLS